MINKNSTKRSYPKEFFPNFGMRNKFHSEETRKKISEGLKGKHPKKLSEEHKRKIGEARKGKKWSEESKRRLRESLRRFHKLNPKLGSGENRRLTRKNRRLKLRFEIFERDNFSCRYCGRKPPEVILEIDHKFPKSKGGKNEKQNYLTSCKDCNIGKGDSILKEFPLEVE